MLSKQISWLQTWKTREGSYNGYVVHRCDLKRMFRIHDTPWSQCPIIKGYLNLFNKTKNEQWLEEAIQAANLQCGRIHQTGKYIFAGFEDDRFSSLIHNSLANCALLDLAEVLIDEGECTKAQKYLKTVVENTDRYIIGVLWDEEFGAFKLSEIDYYSPNKVRFIVNMNSVAVESLVKLSNLTSEPKYKGCAIRVGDWIATEYVNSSGLEYGGINYSHVQPRVFISIYTALAMRGLDDLYNLTKDRKFLEMAERAAQHLINLVDPETKFFYHAVINGELVKYPQFIAGAGIIFNALDDAEKSTGEKFNYQDTLNSVLKKQYCNGAFPNFFGYNTFENNRFKTHCKEVWEDIVPVLGWNAHLFEFLTRKFKNGYFEPSNEIRGIRLVSKNYLYFENKHIVFIFGIRPMSSSILYLVIKKVSFSILYFSLYSIHRLIRILVNVLPDWTKNLLKKNKIKYTK